MTGGRRPRDSALLPELAAVCSVLLGSDQDRTQRECGLGFRDAFQPRSLVTDSPS